MDLEKTARQVGRVRGFLRAAARTKTRVRCDIWVGFGVSTRDLGPLAARSGLSGRAAPDLMALPARPRRNPIFLQKQAKSPPRKRAAERQKRVQSEPLPHSKRSRLRAATVVRFPELCFRLLGLVNTL